MTGAANISCEVVGDPSDPMTTQRTAIFKPLGLELTRQMEAAFGATPEEAGPVDPPPRPIFCEFFGRPSRDQPRKPRGEGNEGSLALQLPEPDPGAHRLLAGVGNLPGSSVSATRSPMESISPCWNTSAQSSGITSCSTASISSPDARPPVPPPKKGRS